MAYQQNEIESVTGGSEEMFLKIITLSSSLQATMVVKLGLSQ